METVAAREPPVSFVRRWFLLPRISSSPSFEVGGSPRGGDSEEAIGSPEAMFNVMLCLQAVAIYFEGTRRVFWML
jgi:hypothetical protein